MNGQTVVDVEVSVHDGGRDLRRHVPGEPHTDRLHQRELTHCVSLVLSSPAIDLPIEEAVGTTESLEAGLAPVNVMQRHERIDGRLPQSGHRARIGRPRRRKFADQGDPVHILHDEERCAGDGRVSAQSQGAWCRDALTDQGQQHAILAAHAVRSRSDSVRRRPP